MTAALSWTQADLENAAGIDSGPDDVLPSSEGLIVGLDTPLADRIAASTTSAAPSAALIAASGAPITAGGIENEISYITGVTSTNTIGAISFGTWNYDTPATYDPALSTASKWGSSTIGTSGGIVTYFFDTASLWSPTEKSALASGLALWAAEANIQFVAAPSAASASFTFIRGTNGGASTGIPGTFANVGGSALGANNSGGSISIDTSVAGFGAIDGLFTSYGGYVFHTFLHEEGHMLGLGHGGSYNGSVNSATQQYSLYDSRLYSIMSYIDPSDANAKYYNTGPVTGTTWGTTTTGGFVYANVPTTPMMLDIVAIQRLYGAATSGPLASGGQVFGFNSNIAGPVGSYFNFNVNTKPIVTLWDGGTNNTLDVSGWSTNANIDLTPGAFSSVNGMTNNIGIALNTQINTAIGGSGNDTISGNAVNNVLRGNVGNDQIFGGTGDDTLDGGIGTNTLNGGGGWDVANYTFATSAATITRNGNGTTSITSVAGGVTDTLTGVEIAHFTDRNVALREAARSDVSGDGADDIVWYNSTAHAISYYEINASGGYVWHNIGGVSAGYTPLMGDFNGDGRSDILWSNGANVSTYLENADGSYTWRGIGGVSAGYTPLIGDFNGDGTSDILWWNGTSINTYIINPNGGYGWRNIGGVAAGYTPYVGDFNGDGTSDIAWWNQSTGAVSYYEINAATGNYTWHNIGAVAPGYTPLVGDFSGDGTSDIAWWNQLTGALSYYEINASTGNYTWHNIGAVSSGYTPFVGDFNNDGKADIGWTGNGSVSYYDINSPTIPGGGFAWHNIGAVGAGYTVVT